MTVSLFSRKKAFSKGDPFGPWLFCNIIRPSLQPMESILKHGYLNDLTVTGPEMTVRILYFGDTLGPPLNIKKCELICGHGHIVRDKVHSSFTITSHAFECIAVLL